MESKEYPFVAQEIINEFGLFAKENKYGRLVLYYYEDGNEKKFPMMKITSYLVNRYPFSKIKDEKEILRFVKGFAHKTEGACDGGRKAI